MESLISDAINAYVWPKKQVIAIGDMSDAELRMTNSQPAIVGPGNPV